MHSSKWEVCFVDEGTSNAIDVSDFDDRFVDDMGVGLSTLLFAISKGKGIGEYLCNRFH